MHNKVHTLSQNRLELKNLEIFSYILLVSVLKMFYIWDFRTKNSNYGEKNYFYENITFSGSYLFCGPSDQTVDPSVSFTNETNDVSLNELIILVRWTTQILHNKDDLGVVRFQRQI